MLLPTPSHPGAGRQSLAASADAETMLSVGRGLYRLAASVPLAQLSLNPSSLAAAIGTGSSHQ